MNYFFSDLDKTLILSGCPKHKCVEWKKDKEITYMTEIGFSLMQDVLNKVCFIPTTMRNLEQTLRIQFIKEHNPEFIICNNGCEIYHNLVLDKEWEKTVREKVKKDNIDFLHHFVNKLDLNFIENRNICSYYLALKFPERVTQKEISILRNNIPKEYNIQWDNKKVFVLPRAVNKANAILYLKDKYNMEGNFYCAGDSNADKEMLELDMMKSFIPKHSNLDIKKNHYISTHIGVYATEDILKEIKKNLC